MSTGILGFCVFCVGTPEVGWSVGWDGTETSALWLNRTDSPADVVGLSLGGLELVKVGRDG